VLRTAEHEAVGLDLPEVDITDPDSVQRALEVHRPDVVINAAAYTAVDDAESNEGLAHRINAEGPAIIAAACGRNPRTKLVHISTDYVFGGEASTPYAEDAATGPTSAYGRTKLAGEQAVLKELPDSSYVVRTAWLYGENGNNFVKTMLRLESERPTLSVVDDQLGQPTWSRDLAGQIVALVAAEAPAGIYHGTSSGETTWCGFTKEIFRLAGADPQRVEPTSTDKFPRPAPRPAYSVLGHRRWAEVGLAPIRRWDEALAEALPVIQRRVIQDQQLHE
jgi:dTDP-4-dehydrorhamnose reductase